MKCCAKQASATTRSRSCALRACCRPPAGFDQQQETETMSRSTFRGVTRRAALLVAGLALAGGATAQAYPDRAIKLVVPFPAGGAADVAARVYADKLGAVLAQPVVIDNKPGATGNIGAEQVARANDGGYTLLFANEFLATNPAMFKELRYDTLRDFVPVSRVASTPVVVAVHPSVPARDLKELLALARAKPMNYATPGFGSGPHLFGQMVALDAGVKLNDVPYKGSAPATADAVGGQVDMIISTLGPMIPYFKSGRLRPLAVTSATRSAQLPEVPTLTEAGLPSQGYETWYGVLAPAATPKAALTRLQQASATVMRDPEVVTRLRAAGLDVSASTPDDFGAEIRADIARWARVVRDANITRN
ncbi:MAG: tripartite tricarboxylate transporter substrate binding protein [Comamonadaceae bacterium]|nr:MAG: tripartite tricarboxylate transporter substrate binding protein [Comamonadaceae bacterium]